MKIGRDIGHSMDIMNVGGGFGAQNISESLEKVLKKTRNDPLKYQVICEPGRFLSSESYFLLTRIIG
jgi:diaminopimelate decarboxylase